MRKERQVYLDKIINIEKELDLATQAEEDGLMTDWEVQWMIAELVPEQDKAEKDFLSTYRDPVFGIPTYAENLGAYDQYQRDNAAGIYR